MPLSIATAAWTAEGAQRIRLSAGHPMLQDDARVIAVTPFALDGAPKEWGHTNWLQLDREGHVLGIYPMFEALRSNR